MKTVCCGAFPDYVCGDCPHANEEQKAAGGVPSRYFRSDGNSGGNYRCEYCFMPYGDHAGPQQLCPSAGQPPRPVAEVVVKKPEPTELRAAVSSVRIAFCPSCAKPWNGTRVPRGIDGMFCGTCGQQAHFQ